MAKKKTKKAKGTKETSGTRYVKIPFKKYKKAILKAEPKKRKVLYKEFEKQRKGIERQEVKRELGVGRKRRVAKKFKERLFKTKDSRKAVARRAAGVRRLLETTKSRKGAGRPKGTYKYGMPIHLYKQKQTQIRALQAQYQAEQQMKLRRRGLSKEAIAQLQTIRTQEEYQRPQQNGRQPIQVIDRPQSQRPRTERQPRVSQRRGYPQAPPNPADDELRFRKWMADKTVSPRTQQMLTEIRRIQNKGKSDNIEQQRRHWERRLVGAHVNLMRAHENMNPVRLDFTGVSQEENILMAPSVFKDDPADNILRQNRPSVTQTREAGNTLNFFES